MRNGCWTLKQKIMHNLNAAGHFVFLNSKMYMLTWNWAKKLDCSTTYWMLKFLHSYLHNFSATRASQRWIAQVNHHLKQEKRKLNSPVITFKTRIMHMLPKRGKDPQVNSEDFSGLKTSFPSCCSNHRVLISLNWSVVSYFKPTVSR